jgi:hypothetical protein
MKLHLHRYLVFSLGICVYEFCAETDLTVNFVNKNCVSVVVCVVQVRL